MKHPTPEQEAKAIALRELGHDTKAVAAQVGLPVRTLERVFQRHGARKGALVEDVRAEIRAELVARITEDAAVKATVAALLDAALEHAAGTTSRLKRAAAHLKEPADLREYLMLARAESASSTALRNCMDATRQLLNMGRRLEDVAELPELCVRVMNERDIQELRQRQEAEDALLTGRHGGDGAEGEIVIEGEPEDESSYP